MDNYSKIYGLSYYRILFFSLSFRQNIKILQLFVVPFRAYSRFRIFLIARKQPVKQTRRRTRNSYCASGNPIFSRSFLPLHYRELRVCHRLPEAEAARDDSSSCLIPHPVLYRLVSSRIHNECRASQLYRVCGRASRFPRTTLAPNPFQPFGSLFSDF